jgi:uncharacterized protein with beta-barrel porin domain
MLKKTTVKVLVVGAVALISLLAWAILAQARPQNLPRSGAVRGAGTSLVRGGTGAPSFAPVITKFGFFWRDGGGGFECLALVPSVQAGKPGSGNFDTNAMYVTGSLTSARVEGQTAVLQGTATVTGLGAGTDRPFTATITRGGPGATLLLKVSGLTFYEIVLDGQITF